MNLSQFTFVLMVSPVFVSSSHVTIVVIYRTFSPLALARLVGLKMTVRGPTGETRVTIARAPRWSMVSHYLESFYATDKFRGNFAVVFTNVSMARGKLLSRSLYLIV